MAVSNEREIGHLLGGLAALLVIPFVAGLAVEGTRRAIDMQGLVPINDLLVTAAAALLAILAARLAVVHLITGACLLAARTGRSVTAGTALLKMLAPRLARRVATVTAGAGLAAGALTVPAAAEPHLEGPAGSSTVPTAEASATDDVLPPLSWDSGAGDAIPAAPAVPTPAETAPPSTPAGSTHAPAPAAPPTPPMPALSSSPSSSAAPMRSADHDERSTVTVERGDSLWSITADLTHSQDPKEIAAAWPQLYEANRDALTTGPDLIHPGAELEVPHDVISEEPR